MSNTRTRARVSFIADLDKINSERKLLGRPPITEQEFFTAISDKQAIIITNSGKDQLTIEAALGYIVI